MGCHVAAKRAAFLAMVLLMASSQLAWGRRVDLLQDEDAPAGALWTFPQTTTACYFPPEQQWDTWPSDKQHRPSVLLAFVISWTAVLHTPHSPNSSGYIADGKAGPGFRFPTVAIPGAAALLTSGAPAAAEAPSLAIGAGAPAGAIAAAAAPGLATPITLNHMK